MWPTRAEIAIDSVKKKDFQIAVMSFNTKIKREKNIWPMLYIFHMDNLNLLRNRIVYLWMNLSHMNSLISSFRFLLSSFRKSIEKV